jgi:hypothetical protein
MVGGLCPLGLPLVADAVSGEKADHSLYVMDRKGVGESFLVQQRRSQQDRFERQMHRIY